ncbi:tyrosine-type recombinase/integrase [Sulfuricystis thermophila]|uniref:tyrosine-type recombinase/integrase n=1 Tax=Sulfuricystis thermophila TaxID=2496847 RepID=UPI0010369EC7|nr:site-specific integrase [Sulfuricystis thermophila]
MAKRLSAQACETVKPSIRDRLLSDGDGLYLRVRPNGTKTWVIEYEHRGKRTKYTIGRYAREGAPGDSIPDWLRHGQQSLTQARSIAGAWKAARRSGRDPVADWEALLEQERRVEAARRAEEEAERNQPTVKDVIEAFMQKIMAGKKSAPAIRYRLDRLAALIGNRKIRDVTRQHVVAALDTIAQGEREGKTAKQLAGEVLTQAKRVWRFAAEREWIADSPIEKLTRAAFGAKPNKRDVTLRLDELAAIWRALDNRELCKSDPVTIAAMKLLILTGQRESEVCEAEWAEFDLVEGLWRLPAERTKSKRAHLVHLAPQAVAILQALKPITGKERHVFSSPLRPKQAIYGRAVNNALATMFKTGKLPNVTQCHVHDFRRTLISRLPDLGFEPFLGHKIANHVLSGVFAHYNHNSYEAQRKAALEAWAALIELLAAGENMTQLQRAA